MSECELSNLIEELEKAEAGSRGLDAWIVEAIGKKVERFTVPDDHPVLQGGLEFMVEDDGTRVGIPPFSGSIDAALTLVPENLRRSLFLETSRPAKAGYRTSPEGEQSSFIYFDAATLPLAICLLSLRTRKAEAALKAREAGQ